jgi:hypothetical protein
MSVEALISTQVIDTTTVGRALMTAVDASGARTTLGLGSLATQSGTFSGTSSNTNTGDQTITLTGDVTGTGTGSFVATIGAAKVTNAMLAGSIAASNLVGTDIATIGTVTVGIPSHLQQIQKGYESLTESHRDEREKTLQLYDRWMNRTGIDSVSDSKVANTPMAE